MSWQDIPLKAINFTSFWLSNNDIKFGRHTLDGLFEYANSRHYKIDKAVLLDILDVMTNLRLLEIGIEIDQKMTFTLDIPKSANLVTQYKKANF